MDVPFTAYEVKGTSDKAGKTTVTFYLDEAMKESKCDTYVAKNETVYFTLPVGTYTVKVGETSKVLEVTDAKAVQSESVTGDITVTYYETKDVFEENVADAVALIGNKGEGVTPTGATITRTEDGWDVKITADYTNEDSVKDTGVMVALKALLTAGYEVSVKLPNGMTQDAAKLTSRDDVETLLPEKGQEGSYEVTISNGEFTQTYTVDVSCDW